MVMGEICLPHGDGAPQALFSYHILLRFAWRCKFSITAIKLISLLKIYHSQGIVQGPVFPALNNRSRDLLCFAQTDTISQNFDEVDLEGKDQIRM